MMSKDLALFDFDGTMTKQDSANTFYKFIYKSKIQYFMYNYVFCFAHIILLKLNLITYMPLKQLRLKLHTSRFSDEKLLKISNEYKQHVLLKMIIPHAMDRFKWHIQQGHDVWIVSASFDFILNQWCNENGFNLITNKTIYINQKRVMVNRDVNYEGKVDFIRAIIDLKKYTEIYAYGDSNGDRAMLDIASKPFYRLFN